MDAALASDQQVAEVAIGLVLSGRVSVAECAMLMRRLGANETGEHMLESAKIERLAVNGSLARARTVLDQAKDSGIDVIPLSSDRYPKQLRLLADAPSVLYVRGQAEALRAPKAAAVVGTRRASAQGLEIARRIAEFLSEHGWSVVSGLALGIDRAAHEGCLEGSMPTFAVLACGLDWAQPRANADLAQRILEHGGAWVSEQPPGTPVRDTQLVTRTRIQVGLAAGSIIVEGAAKSGTQSHAAYCKRERRALFAVVPHGIKTVSALPRALVAAGATALSSREDYPAMLEALLLSAQQQETLASTA
jgi:DNA processing protein